MATVQGPMIASASGLGPRGGFCRFRRTGRLVISGRIASPSDDRFRKAPVIVTYFTDDTHRNVGRARGRVALLAGSGKGAGGRMVSRPLSIGGDCEFNSRPALKSRVVESRWQPAAGEPCRNQPLTVPTLRRRDGTGIRARLGIW